MSDHPASPEPLLESRALSKHFGGVKVFSEFSITLDKADILGVIGPNGAGKTTFINVVSGQIPASSGEIFLNGRNITRLNFQTRSRLGLMRTFQQTKTFKSATIRENLDRAGLFSQKTLDLSDATTQTLLERAGLAQRMDQVADTLPYGMQKMLGLMMAFVTRPIVLMLDEPAAGLEKEERYFIDVYCELAMKEIGCSILLVEHDMDLVKRLCPRLCVLEGGHLIAQGDTQ